MDIAKARKLVGEVTKEQLRYVDCFVSDSVGLFMPAAGACFYALTPRHTHPAYMFLLHFNDQSETEICGRRIRSVTGKLFSLSPGIEHHELPADTPPRYIAIMIEPAFFESRLKSYRLKKALRFEGGFHDPGPDLLPLLRRFMAEAATGLPGGDEVLDAIGAEICHSIIRCALKITAPADTLTTRLEVDRAIEFIHAHIAEKLTLNRMAGAASMSASHFARVFKREVGESPADYLVRVRLERARRLLMDSTRTLTEVALDCGFGSASYFSDRFTRKYGITPSAFRHELGSGVISK